MRLDMFLIKTCWQRGGRGGGHDVLQEGQEDITILQLDPPRQDTMSTWTIIIII
jgi:hypothetical protein